MSPAPIVTRTSPSRSRGARARSARLGVDEPPDRAARGAVGGRPRDREAADAFERPHRPLAGRIDVEHADLVRGRQGRAEALGESLGARVQMRLEDRDQPARPELAKRLERRGHLGRVVGVVVVDRRAVPVSLELEAAQDPGEGGERARRRLELEARQLQRRPERRARSAGCGDPGPSARAPGPGCSSSKPTTRCSPARPARLPSPGSASPRAGSQNRRKASSSSAREDQCEWWSSSTLVTTATSGRRRRKLASDSSASATTHSPAPQPAFPGPPSSPAPGSSPPSRKPGSAPIGAQDVDEHPGGRRLAVGAGDRQQALLGAQLGEQLAPMDHRLAALAGARELGVVLPDRGRDHHLGVRRDGVGVVAHARLEARRSEALEV